MDQRGDVLQLAQEVRREMPSEMTSAPARGGERQAEENRGRSISRQGDAAGPHLPKALRHARKRRLVDHARTTWQVSIRRACRALPVDRSTYHYRSRRAGQAQLIERIKEMAARPACAMLSAHPGAAAAGASRCCCGRRIQVLRRREGWPVNTKRVYRLYREMGLQLVAREQFGTP